MATEKRYFMRRGGSLPWMPVTREMYVAGESSILAFPECCDDGAAVAVLERLPDACVCPKCQVAMTGCDEKRPKCLHCGSLIELE